LIMAVPIVLCALAADSQKLGWIPFGLFLYFILTLAPALGFVNVYPMRFSFVADHFQYLASLGILAGIAALIREGQRRLGISVHSFAGMAIVGLLLFNLGIRSSLETWKYRTSKALWTDTLAKNPDGAIAHHNYAMAIVSEGNIQEAITHLERAEELDPGFSQTPLALAFLYRREGRASEAIVQYQRAFALGVQDPVILNDYETLEKSYDLKHE
jgi:tetratricopeptide (TPR) repeat protein